MFGAFKSDLDLPKTDVKFTYLILSQPRTGSTMITSALVDSGIAGVPVEYFHKDYLKELPQPLTLNTVHRYYVDVVSRRTSANGVFGMKMHHLQFRPLFMSEDTSASGQDMITPAGAKFLKSFDRVIQTSRRDKVAQAISNLVAFRTAHWNSDRKDQEGQHNYEFSKDDVPLLLEYIRGAVEGEMFWDRICAELGLNPLKIVYEELSTSPQAELQRVKDHLGLPAIDIAPRTVKMSRDSNREAKRRFLEEIGGDWQSDD